MTRFEVSRLEVLLRVRDFGATHRELFPKSSTGAEALATVAQAAAAIGDLTTTKQVTASHGREAMTTARTVILERMRALARTARVLQKTGGADQRLRMPGRTSDVALVTTARTFLREGEARKDELVRLGLSASCLSELRTAADELESALVERRNGQVGVSEAQSGIDKAIADGTAAVRIIDTFLTNTLEGNQPLFAAWKTVRRIPKGRSRAAEAPMTEPDAVPVPAAAPTSTPVEPAVDLIRRAS